ncbi:FG-GAP-like repeat-containing protein [Fulvivirga maritima]|uniref:FG-GAP-like repeat-containing protein n=1 Tax=Fulvivirga maritima TaxID=2904247 RepID=UPI001F3017AA|nr:FG-GAP-like repeat-containing protein [Fulvivirga maritima]UII24814.1 FG-GAP-like repeat-containing protein [Fulvivirga maritima]
MKSICTFLFLITSYTVFPQSCPTIDKRNNGNGQANRCAGIDGTPVASNFVGTSYAIAPSNMAKTGDITFVYDAPITSPPAIKRIWIGNVLSEVIAGPASVPEISGNTTIVKYCFYVSNLPPAASFTLEFVDPQTDSVLSYCGYSGSDDSNVSPPVILTQPLSQTSCTGETVNLSVIAESTNAGALNYQWRKNGAEIDGATQFTYAISPVALEDAGQYDCLVGEATGSFVLSDFAMLKTVDCSTNNVYMDKCGNGNLVQTFTDSWNNAWVDYNNDNWEDLFITNKHDASSNYLYENNSSSFSKITGGQLLSSFNKSASSAWADIDNDGDMDVCVVNATGSASMIYLNNGNETFTSLPNSGVDAHPQYFHGAAWADFDNDGYVDLILTNFFQTRFHHLYKNNGNNTFTKITNTPVTAESNRSTSPLLADYDNDGLVDIFIPNGNNQANSFFKNLGNFRFTKITSTAITSASKNAVGGAWGDYDGDGFLDLFIANSSNQNNELYKNNGNGTFSQINASIVSNDKGHSHGANWIDIDNDADLDLFVTNDNGPNFLYLNDGAGNFIKAEDEEIATDIGLNYGQAWADYNKDGFLDVMISFHSNQKDRLYCNKTNGNNWINIKLEGVVSNQNGIGAQIKVKANGKWQYREINPMSGFGSQNSIRAHLGLNDASVIDSIEVNWPSGIKQILTSQNTNRFMTIVEESANSVQGLVFHDLNGNCIKDTEEPTLSDIALIINEQQRQVSSDKNGALNFHIQEGTYNFSLAENSYWNMACSSEFTVATGNNNINIPLHTSTSGYDLTVDYSTTAWRRGFTSESVISYSNLGTVNASNSYLVVQYPAEVKINQASVPYTQDTDNEYTFFIGTVKPGETKSIIVTDSVTLDATVGQEFTVTTTIAADGTDLNLENNIATELNTIVGAIDPNDIAVSPRGQGSDHFVSKDEVLTYKIRFQNVGTYYASRVSISCPLSSYLDFSSIEIVNVSHDYQYSIDQRGVLRIDFPNIHLPDSTTNEMDSHGFFKFKIKPKADLTGGEQIIEKATIAFDYEDPITTNSVFNTIKYESKGDTYQLLIYPNPATDEAHFTLDIEFYKYDDYTGLTQIDVYSLQGNLVKQYIPNDEDFTSIDLAGWHEGQYIIKAYDAKNNVYLGRLIKY